MVVGGLEQLAAWCDAQAPRDPAARQERSGTASLMLGGGPRAGEWSIAFTSEAAGPDGTAARAPGSGPVARIPRQTRPNRQVVGSVVTARLDWEFVAAQGGPKRLYRDFQSRALAAQQDISSKTPSRTSSVDSTFAAQNPHLGGGGMASPIYNHARWAIGK